MIFSKYTTFSQGSGSKEYSTLWLRFKKEARRVLALNSLQLFMAVLLLISLFLPDAWILGNSPEYTDVVKSSIIFIIFVLFMFVFFCLCLVQDV
jgi:hypothetical protein